jgi:hypothetical protein
MGLEPTTYGLGNRADGNDRRLPTTTPASNHAGFGPIGAAEMACPRQAVSERFGHELGTLGLPSAPLFREQRPHRISAGDHGGHGLSRAG